MTKTHSEVQVYTHMPAPFPPATHTDSSCLKESQATRLRVVSRKKKDIIEAGFRINGTMFCIKPSGDGRKVRI